MNRARRRALVIASIIAGAVLACIPARALDDAWSGALAQADVEREAVVVLAPRVPFDELLGVPVLAALARAGGAALLVDPGDAVKMQTRVLHGEHRLVLDPTAAGELEDYVRDLPGPAGTPEPDEVLVIVMGADPLDSDGELAGVVVARGAPNELFPETGDLGALTSDSTRRPGVVAGVDVDATLREYLRGGETAVGAPIRTTAGPPPLELYRRYLAQRRMYVPVGTAGALYLTAAGLAAIGALAARRTIPERWRRIAGWGALSVAMLPTGMLAAGHLHELSYATAVPMIAIVTAFGTMAFSPLARGEVTLVPAGIGVAVLAFFAVEGLTGWSGMLTPLLGGSQLDGGRFYGFPNVAIGLTVGAALWVAHRFPTWTGFWILCGLGLFIGLPYVGSNFGGAVTSFVAAGLWMAIRERERLGAWLGAGVVAAVAALGGAVILVAHAVAPLETHISAFEENVSGVGGVVEKFVGRLEVGIDLIARSPAALVPVIGLPILLFVVLRPPAPIRGTFERWPAWRDAVLVTVLAGIVAYVVNDSGPAAGGLAFGLGLGGMLGVSLLVAPGKMGER